MTANLVGFLQDAGLIGGIEVTNLDNNKDGAAIAIRFDGVVTVMIARPHRVIITDMESFLAEWNLHGKSIVTVELPSGNTIVEKQWEIYRAMNTTAASS